jgi:hypothetical protein
MLILTITLNHNINHNIKQEIAIAQVQGLSLTLNLIKS